MAAGNQRLYDDNAFQVFSIALLFMIVAPWTFFYVWGIISDFRKEADPKAAGKRQKKSSSATGKIVKGVVIVLLWALLYHLTQTVEVDEHKGFNPYEVLGVNEDATTQQIKSAYRQLSRKFHPDKNVGNDQAADMMILINKAYETLTDEKLKAIWEARGDDTGERSIGIGLPQWMLQEDSKYLVVGAYVAFLVILVPIIVCVFYFKNKSVGSNAIKKATHDKYWTFLHEYTHMKQFTEILCMAEEFTNLNFSCSASDLSEMFEAITKTVKLRTEGALQPFNFTKLKKFSQDLIPTKKPPKKTEGPLNRMYYNNLRANVFLLAHLCRIEPPSSAAKKDMEKVKALIPWLGDTLVKKAFDGNMKIRAIDAQTVLSVLQYHQRLIQAVSPFQEGDELHQIPHYEKLHLKKRKKDVSLLKLLAEDEESRKEALQGLDNEEERMETEDFLRNLPCVTLDIDVSVEGYKSVCVGDYATIKMTLTRENVEENEDAPLVHAPHLPDEKKEVWYLIAEMKHVKDVEAMKRAEKEQGRGDGKIVKKALSKDSKKLTLFIVPFYEKITDQGKVVTATKKVPLFKKGKNEIKIHAVCDSYVGLDVTKVHTFYVKAQREEGEEEEVPEDGIISEPSSEDEGDDTYKDEDAHDQEEELSASDSESEDEADKKNK